MLWPRAAIAAEIFWSGSNRSFQMTENSAPLHALRDRMVQAGIRAAPLQPHWCALRPGKCGILVD